MSACELVLSYERSRRQTREGEEDLNKHLQKWQESFRRLQALLKEIERDLQSLLGDDGIYVLNEVFCFALEGRMVDRFQLKESYFPGSFPTPTLTPADVASFVPSRQAAEEDSARMRFLVAFSPAVAPEAVFPSLPRGEAEEAGCFLSWEALLRMGEGAARERWGGRPFFGLEEEDWEGLEEAEKSDSKTRGGGSRFAALSLVLFLSRRSAGAARMALARFSSRLSLADLLGAYLVLEKEDGAGKAVIKGEGGDESGLLLCDLLSSRAASDPEAYQELKAWILGNGGITRLLRDLFVKFVTRCELPKINVKMRVCLEIYVYTVKAETKTSHIYSCHLSRKSGKSRCSNKTKTTSATTSITAAARTTAIVDSIC